MQGSVGLHTGIAYRDGATEAWRIIHLAWHEMMEVNDEPNGWDRWALIPPAIDPLDLETLAIFCAVRAQLGPGIRYGFRFDETTIDDAGNVVLGPNEIGLTCATFVMAMFDHAKIALLAGDSWKTREEDLAAQRQLAAMMRRSTRALLAHKEALEREVGCMRFRAEEVAAATAFLKRPVPFVAAEMAGAAVFKDFKAMALPDY